MRKLKSACLLFFCLYLTPMPLSPASIPILDGARKFVLDNTFGDYVSRSVEVSRGYGGTVIIKDMGDFFLQYSIAGPQDSNDPDIIIDPQVRRSSAKKDVVIVTHGWIDNAAEDWSKETAAAIAEKVDPNQWLCCSFDWRGGAVVLNPVDAVKYARDVAGPRLAKALLSLNCKIKHVHLIGHSAGVWAINSAAKIIAQKTGAELHITFLDAYVPLFWSGSELGDIDGKTVWTEHYYTKDALTGAATYRNLTHAHNIDITDITPKHLLSEHEFPYRWYYATVTGRFALKGMEIGEEVIFKGNSVDYGFSRSLEAGEKNWKSSLRLKCGNKAVKIEKPKDGGEVDKWIYGLVDIKK